MTQIKTLEFRIEIFSHKITTFHGRRSKGERRQQKQNYSLKSVLCLAFSIDGQLSLCISIHIILLLFGEKDSKDENFSHSKCPEVLSSFRSLAIIIIIRCVGCRTRQRRLAKANIISANAQVKVQLTLEIEEEKYFSLIFTSLYPLALWSS